MNKPFNPFKIRLTKAQFNLLQSNTALENYENVKLALENFSHMQILLFQAKGAKISHVDFISEIETALKQWKPERESVEVRYQDLIELKAFRDAHRNISQADEITDKKK